MMTKKYIQKHRDLTWLYIHTFMVIKKIRIILKYFRHLFNSTDFC